MVDFGGFNFNFPVLKNLIGKTPLAKNPIQKQEQQKIEDLKDPKKNTPNQSLANTNSNININNPTQSSPAVTQGTANASNKPQQQNVNQEIRNNLESKTRESIQRIGSQGAKDLPVYAGIQNMSMKSWVADQLGKNYTKLESGDRDLKATLEGIKGFQKENYDSSSDLSDGQEKKDRRKSLLILSHIFAESDGSGLFEVNFLNNLSSFKKLGSNKQQHDTLPGETLENKKTAPPSNELAMKLDLGLQEVKNLSKVFTLPESFPECIRLFAKDRVLIDPRELKSFFENRLAITQEALFTSKDPELKELLTEFAPLIKNSNSPILPLILLYYPLPLPYVVNNYDFEREWRIKKTKEDFIASCEIYYYSKPLGRFLLKFFLNKKEEFSFFIQTSENNNDIVKELEEAIAEIMLLLEHPPTLTELNVKLQEEIYNATDKDEELSIFSTGPLRIEIILAVYASLTILNKYSYDPNPKGIIDLLE